MIGGEVVETLAQGDRLWVNCEDHGSQCAIYLDRNGESESITPGDSIWWHTRTAYWTRYDGAGNRVGERDVPLVKIGYSGVPRPSS